ncbi:MAG TPA: DNA alkylation repair protein [Rhodothermales bacterium]|nr:DNA alkylation repair protein [Rhodothermales bacterium]
MADKVATLQQTLRDLGDPERATHSQRYFKTGPGEYGESDVFRGIRVPVLRALVKEQDDLSLDEIERLLHTHFHEDRLLALLILVRRYKRGNVATKQAVYDLYLRNTAYINNWDLVDSSAPQIVGTHLLERTRDLLYELVESDDLWERRIAILATQAFIRQDDFEDTLKLSALLLEDDEDLIHKAVGWMLREVGKRHLEAEEAFLRVHYQQMPRTMLRYAIEKFPEPKRQAYLKGIV